MLKNKLHGETVLGNPSLLLVRSLKQSLKEIQKKMKMIECKLLALVEKVHQEVLTCLKSIPGIGREISLMLIVLTDRFKRFKSASRLCSYSGLIPIIRQSGSSVKGILRISKIGNQKLRDLLFMWNFNTCKYNKAYKAICDRIVAKRKSKILANSCL
jgi:transposase